MRGDINKGSHRSLYFTDEEEKIAFEVELREVVDRLSDATKAGFVNVESQLKKIRGNDPFAVAPTKSLSDCSETIESCCTKLNGLETLVETVRLAQERFEENKDTPSGSKGVRFGALRFLGISDVTAWAEENLPASFPFGVFVDVYSFLERVQCFRESSGFSKLKNMDVRRKLEVTADEALVIEGFKHPLPKVFSGNSTETTMLTNWLPGVKTKSSWEDEHGLRGTKITIKESIVGIEACLTAIIHERLTHHVEAKALALQMLSVTITFITNLSRFISETFLRLETAGFDDKLAWDLVSKLVHRMFAMDCHDKRGVVHEFLDATDRRELFAGVMWGTLVTHQVMQEYTRYGCDQYVLIMFY